MLITKFLLFNVILLSMDIASDFQTAISFFQSGDFYWGLATILVIFAPFLAVLIFSIVTKISNNLEKVFWTNILWQFPFFHPIRLIFPIFFNRHSICVFRKITTTFMTAADQFQVFSSWFALIFKCINI